MKIKIVNKTDRELSQKDIFLLTLLGAFIIFLPTLIFIFVALLIEKL